VNAPTNVSSVVVRIKETNLNTWAFSWSPHDRQGKTLPKATGARIHNQSKRALQKS